MTWFRAAALVMAVVYLAQLTPFVVGPLLSCDHCIDLYARYYVFVPGFLPTMYFGLEDKVFATVAILFTIAMLAVITIAVRKFPRWAVVGVLMITALLAGYNALGLSHVLRM